MYYSKIDMLALTALLVLGCSTAKILVKVHFPLQASYPPAQNVFCSLGTVMQHTRSMKVDTQAGMPREGVQLLRY